MAVRDAAAKDHLKTYVGHLRHGNHVKDPMPEQSWIYLSAGQATADAGAQDEATGPARSHTHPPSRGMVALEQRIAAGELRVVAVDLRYLHQGRGDEGYVSEGATAPTSPHGNDSLRHMMGAHPHNNTWLPHPTWPVWGVTWYTPMPREVHLTLTHSLAVVSGSLASPMQLSCHV